MLNSTTYAGVAELADALASGASELRLVKVQVLSPAPLSCAHSVECAFLLTLRRDTVPHLAPYFRHVVGQTQLGLKAGQSEARYLFSLTSLDLQVQNIFKGKTLKFAVHFRH